MTNSALGMRGYARFRHTFVITEPARPKTSGLTPETDGNVRADIVRRNLSYRTGLSKAPAFGDHKAYLSPTTFGRLFRPSGHLDNIEIMV